MTGEQEGAWLNRIICGDARHMDEVPDAAVQLVITSPPYNVDIHYNSHADNLSYEDYLEFTQKWIKKCFDLAKGEGRFLLNIPLDKNKGGQKISWRGYYENRERHRLEISLNNHLERGQYIAPHCLGFFYVRLRPLCYRSG